MGSARTAITATATAPSSLGWRSTNADQRAANPVGISGSGPCSASRRRSLRLRARVPISDSRAGEQGDGGGDGEHHGERGGHGDAVEEVQPEDQHAQQGDAHGRTREHDRPAGGGDGVGGGLGDAQAALQPAPVPGDDEQRVVDAHAQPDQQAEHRREVRDGHHMPEQHDARVGGAHAHQRGGDGQQGRRRGSRRRGTARRRRRPRRRSRRCARRTTRSVRRRCRPARRPARRSRRPSPSRPRPGPHHW